MSFVEYPAMGVSRAFLFAILPVCTPLVLLYAMRSARRRIRAVLASGSAR
jgi:TRAP-type C4-dicarboxylate transport system permease small subunit